MLLLATVEARASCATMQKLAQEHSNDIVVVIARPAAKIRLPGCKAARGCLADTNS
jgi:hypothetical protein